MSVVDAVTGDAGTNDLHRYRDSEADDVVCKFQRVASSVTVRPDARGLSCPGLPRLTAASRQAPSATDRSDVDVL